MAIKGLPMGLGSQLTPQEQETRLDEITADPNLQHRASERTDLIDEYAEAMKRGEQFPAIRVVKDNAGTLWLYRGFTRRQAALNIGRKTFPTIVEPGSYRDAWLKSLGENHDHGGRRTRDDLHRAIDAALSDDEIKYALLDDDKEKWSFRKVAKYARTNHHTVSNHWKEIHYPQIVKQVDEELRDALRRHTYSDVQENLYKDVANRLNLPAWFVRERLEEAHRSGDAENDPNDSDAPHAERGNFPTRQTGSTFYAENYPNDSDVPHAERGNFPTRQTGNTFDTENDPNDSDVTHAERGKFPTRQTGNTFDTENDPNDSDVPHAERGKFPTRQTGSTFDTENDQEEETATSAQKPSQTASALPKVTRAKALTELIIMTNAHGGNVWQFNNPKYVKVSIISEAGELKEYELPRPHEGILLSMFPRVDQG